MVQLSAAGIKALRGKGIIARLIGPDWTSVNRKECFRKSQMKLAAFHLEN